MLKILLKSRLSAFWASYSGRGSSKKKKQQSLATKVLLTILFVFIIGYLMFAFGAMVYMLDEMALQTGQIWVSLTLASLVASALCVIGSVFTAKTQIFESKDNELLLAMPIPPKYIFLSRIIMLLIVNYALEAIVMLPAIIVHAFVVGFAPLGALFTLLCVLLLPFFTLSLTVLLAWLISIISARLKNKTVISVLFTVLFMGAYFIACGAFGGFVGSTSAEEGPVMVDMSGLKKSLIFFWMGSAMAEGSALSLLFVALCSIIPAVIVFCLLNHSFIKIITTNTGAKRIKYVAKEGKVSTPDMALFNKEIKRFFSSSAYILNSGMGNIMTIIGAVLLAIVGQNLFPLIEISPMFETIIPTGAAMLIMFMASMNMVSAPSISLEDRCLWILQSAPIEPKKVLRAKVLTHIVICTPCTLVSSLIVAIALKFSFINLIFCVLSGLSMVLLSAYFGMFLGIKFPKFDWQNETVAVKQGFAVFGSMLGTMLISMIFLIGGVGLAILGVGFWLIGLIVVTINVGLSVAFGAYLARGGAKAFENLKH